MRRARQRNSPAKGIENILSLTLSIIALAISAVAAYYAYQQVAVAKDTAQRQLRPYVFIRGGGVMLNETASSVQAFIQVQNYGQTPVCVPKIRLGVDAGNGRGKLAA
jgi:hypothetical protein